MKVGVSTEFSGASEVIDASSRELNMFVPGRANRTAPVTKALETTNMYAYICRG